MVPARTVIALVTITTKVKGWTDNDEFEELDQQAGTIPYETYKVTYEKGSILASQELHRKLQA